MPDTFETPVPEPTCVGWSQHQWTLAIEEGQVTIHTDPCGETCEVGIIGLGDYHEYAHMEPIPVTVAMATECPAYPTDDNCVPNGPKVPMRGYESGSHYIAHGTRCDCNWWPVIVPLVTEPSDA